jgi:uncharacterized protein YecE (DUF72 family)
MPRAGAPRRPAPDLDATHDPGVAVASRRAEQVLGTVASADLGQPIARGAHEIRIGTASWADPTLTAGAIFYPSGVSSADARLRWYASQFSVVEVDATYYSLPARAIAERWVERTPDGFLFHVKAHALMTGQPTEVARLPADLRDALPAASRAGRLVYGHHLPDELRREVWRRFLDALAPLREAGKLGGVLLQYPRWVTPTPANDGALAEAATWLDGVTGHVELRNRQWFDGAVGDGRGTDWTLALLRDLGLAHVVVDGPQGLESSVPFVPAVTTGDRAIVRLHGRRAATWEAVDTPTVERYRYLYGRDELDALLPRLEQLAAQARQTSVLLNNCYGNYGTTNARELLALLSRVDDAAGGTPA